MSFADVIGQESAIRLLKGQLAEGRLAHATLFVGAEGIGKRRLALECARALICRRPLADGGCGACEPCEKVAVGTHPDLIVTEPRDRTESGEERKTRQIDIEQIRELERRMGLTPFSGRWKVAILDEAELLGDVAVHACLKMLEEPTARSIFLLIAPAAHLLPATVVSRCQVVRCAPQGVERVFRHLQEKEGLDPGEARRLAVCSGGRLGLALKLHRTGALAAKNEKLDQILAAHQGQRLEIPLGKGLRDEALEALEWYAAWCRDLLVLALGGSPDWVIHQDRLVELNRPSSIDRRSTIGALLERIDRTYRIHEAVGRNANLRTALGALLSDG